MIEVTFYDKVEDNLLNFAVIITKTNGKWELKEETGAVDFTIKPIYVYSVKGKTRKNETIEVETFGMLFIANIFSFEPIQSEIEKIVITDNLVDNWTYPFVKEIQYMANLDIYYLKNGKLVKL